MGYELGIVQERNGLCSTGEPWLPEALLRKIDSAVDIAKTLQPEELLARSDQELLDGILSYKGSRVIEFGEASVAEPGPWRNWVAVKKTMPFTGDPLLLYHWPKTYNFEGPFGSVESDGWKQKGKIEVFLIIAGYDADNPPPDEELADAFAENDGKLLKLAEWANAAAVRNNEQMRQRLSAAISERRYWQEKQAEVYGSPPKPA